MTTTAKPTRAQDAAHAKTYRSPYGAWHVTAPEFMASAAAPAFADHPATVEAPLRAVAAAQAAGLRTAATPVPARPNSRAASPARTAARERAQAFVAANAQPKPPMQGMNVRTTESARERYARLDALANALPLGRYALPRREDAGAGQSMYFFEVQKYRKGQRIVMLTGGVGAFAQHTMSTSYQEVALTKIAADPKAAAVRFGQETSTCARCGSPLTNDASRARGLGPDCAKHY